MNYDFSIDKKKPLTVSRFKQSPKHGGEYREVENILSKLLYVRDKDSELKKDLEAKLKKTIRKPPLGVVSHWMKPTGIKISLGNMSDKDLQRMTKKQSILHENHLVNLKGYFGTFKPTEPGVGKSMESVIHKELFETDITRSSVTLDMIDEVKEEEKKKYTPVNTVGTPSLLSTTTPNKQNFMKVNYTTPSKTGDARLIKRYATQPDGQHSGAVPNSDRQRGTNPVSVIEQKLREIEGLVLGSGIGYQGKANLMASICNLKALVGVEMGALQQHLTPEKGGILGEKNGDCPSAKKSTSAKSCVERTRRAPLNRIHQNTSINRYTNTRKKNENSKKKYKSFLESNRSKNSARNRNEPNSKGNPVDGFDLAFLTHHNFSHDMISAFK